MDNRIPARLQPLYERLSELVNIYWSDRRCPGTISSNTGISVIFEFPKTTSDPGFRHRLSVVIASNDLTGIQAVVDQMHLPDDITCFVSKHGDTIVTIDELTKRFRTFTGSHQRATSKPRQNKTSERRTPRTRIPDP